LISSSISSRRSPTLAIKPHALNVDERGLAHAVEAPEGFGRDSTGQRRGFRRRAGAKRGRPAAGWPVNWLERLTGYDTKSHRARVDRAYALTANGVLRDEPERYAWLRDPPRRWSVLTQLGRLLRQSGEQACRRLAAQLCADPPASTKEARRQVAAWRREPIDDDLADGFQSAIRAHRRGHVDTDAAAVLAALEAVAAEYADLLLIDAESDAV